ncbi:OLC1v1035310C1 [Oldenlandia corymbosa var. corymbosa]|uniref:OLC1v1035310C1 n=1 Tax=Oldenlandia corymbosa var. corymbosa TaxID=529605 RepID=A0AAV1CTJ5_OLDCO|nr:OLC1v1035310C1 [Oldenlandia corymbosa var. corymbosa]
MNARVLHYERNFFIIKFRSHEDLLTILGNCPYAVEGGLLVLRRCSDTEDLALDGIRIDKLSVRVRMHGVPITLLNYAGARDLAKRVGEVALVKEDYVSLHRLCWCFSEMQIQKNSQNKSSQTWKFQKKVDSKAADVVTDTQSSDSSFCMKIRKAQSDTDIPAHSKFSTLDKAKSRIKANSQGGWRMKVDSDDEDEPDSDIVDQPHRRKRHSKDSKAKFPRKVKKRSCEAALQDFPCSFQLQNQAQDSSSLNGIAAVEPEQLPSQK